MDASPLFPALAFAAISVGSLHSLAPDHWVPFAALARSRGWSAARTARVTLACGFGHVTVSALLGLLGLFFGREVFERVGTRMEALAGVLLIGFGVAYALWGLRRATRDRLVVSHEHAHEHAHSGSHGHEHGHEQVPAAGHAHRHVHAADLSTLTTWTLFLLFCADPCVAVIPLLFAAAPLGTAQAVGIVLLYEVATLLTMVLLVLPARAGARLIRLSFLDRWGDATAGGLIAAVGLLVAGLGW